MVFVIIALALGGLWLSAYIYVMERSGKPLVCPFDGSCEIVVHSGYSIILGTPVYVLGIFYYAALALLFWTTIIVPPGFYALAVFAAVALSASGFLMSLYFAWLQLGVIKRWCTLCISSALISTAIFVISLCGFWPIASPFIGI